MANSMILFPNADKKKNERWDTGRSLINFPCPSRILICSSPGCGKTTLILNIIINAKPIYKQIYLMHPALRHDGSEVEDDDPEEFDDEVREYSAVDFQPLYDIPNPTFFNDDEQVKKFLVVDDCEMRTLNKEQKKRMNKLVSYASSHCNMTIIIASQCVFSQLPVSTVRFCNVFVIYPYADLNYNRMLFNRIGVSSKELPKIEQTMKNFSMHDSLCIDRTEHSPAKYRKNIFEPIPDLL